MSYKWTMAQHRAASIRMKKAYADKKLKDKNKLENPKVPYNAYQALKNNASDVGQAQQIGDMVRINEFHYRRGLVTAMECILRELR